MEALLSRTPIDADFEGKKNIYLYRDFSLGVACHAKRKKLTRKTKKTLLNTTFKSVFYYL